MDKLISHQYILNNLVNYHEKNQLCGSWIFSGIKGVGKAYTANLLAQKLIGDNISNLKIVERSLTDTEKKDLIKLIQDGKELNPEKEAQRARKADITVDDIREIESFVNFKSLDNTPKIVIIDSVDEMNNNAANALLKTLEEPPSNTIMILISHQMQKLLPTIKSRCKVIKFMPISEDVLKQHLKENFTIKNIDLILSISEGSIGKAYEFIANDGEVLYENILDALVIGASPIGVNKNNIDLFFELIYTALNRLVKYINGVDNVTVIEANAFESLKYPPIKIMKIYTEALEKYNKSRVLNLDKISVLDSIFFNLKRLK